METTLLAIFVPIAYVSGWLVSGRIIFSTIMDQKPDLDGPMAMLLAIIWPILIFLVPAWMFVTWPELKKERESHQAKIEQQKKWEGRAKTAELERQIYGQPFTLGGFK